MRSTSKCARITEDLKRNDFPSPGQVDTYAEVVLFHFSFEGPNVGITTGGFLLRLIRFWSEFQTILVTSKFQGKSLSYNGHGYISCGIL